MSVKVVVPQIGQSIAEATIVKWFRKAGESIEKGETLVEIGTDKINSELPAPVTGIVEKILVAEGETVPINTEIAVISGDGEAKTEAADAVLVPDAENIQVAERDDSRKAFSPVVRKLAQEHGVDLSRVVGTGAGGRVTKEDILQVAQNSGKKEAPPAEERVPMTRMRKLIAEHMSMSRRTAADVTTVFEIDMTEAALERQRAKDVYQSQFGIKLTYLPFVVAAAVKALRAFPVVNGSIDGDALVYHRHVNMGIAVAVEEGLLVPVLLRADEKNVLEIARGLQDLSERARAKKLSPEELQNGTFTITNPGVFGALIGTPIIHQPQVAILGVGAVVKRAVVVDDAIVVRSMAYFSLSYDHRALDGATADQFLAHIKKTFETDCPRAESK